MTETIPSDTGTDRHAGHAGVAIAGERVRICLTVDDPALARHLSDVAEAERENAVRRALSVGVRGLETMGVGISVAHVGEEVDRVLSEVTAEAEARVARILEESRRSVAASLDPAQRDSITSRTIAEVQAVHTDLLARLDPDNSGGHTGRLVARLGDLLGPDGLLEQRLDAALDPDAEGSALGRIQRALDDRFRELRDLMVGGEARRAEAARGTAKGVAFEDAVESLLRREAGRLGGATVEVTTTTAGGLGPESKVGDFVVTLANGRRVVVEAKNVATIVLRGKGGILDELDRAMANREADYAICVSALDAFPSEVGVFGVFADRVLVVDDGSGPLLAAALRWAAAAVAGAGAAVGDVDVAQLASGLERIHDLAARISSAKKALTGIRSGVDQVRNDLDAMRCDLLDGVDDAIRALHARSGDEAAVVAVIDQVRAKRSSPGPSGPTRVASSSKSSYG
jgi:hypothetical protein